MAKKDLMKAVKTSKLVAGDANQALQNMGVIKPKEEDPATRVTYIIKESLQQKVKYIAVMEKKQIKEVVNDMFEQFVADWEKKSGKKIEL